LDLRGNLDFSRRHLPGAHSLPIHLFRDSLSTLIDEHWPAADLSKLPLVFYCYGPDCIRSRNGASMAARQGFRDLLWYREGVEGWRRTGLPLHK
jgi:thiosulfate/3-mercaptopyruvate sulfurtransferase